MPYDSGTLRWQLQLRSPVDRVFELLATDSGREQFWVEDSKQQGDVLDFRYPGGATLSCRILEYRAPASFAITHFDGTTVHFTLEASEGGTHLLLEERGLTGEGLAENRAGWVSVLMALKARADFDVDLRNHHPARTWETGYPDN
jgi:uncharacterized protein YndB with AHSA1/START domain